MARLIVAVVAALGLVLGCSSENTNAGLMGPPSSDAGSDIIDVGAEGDAGAVEADGGTDGETGAETGGDAADAPCTSVQHFNGYSTFGDCHEVGYYDEALALKACAVYMNVSCEVLTSLNLCGGINLVGHKSDAWIVWTWTATTGTTRLSWSTPPECPTAADPVWW